MKQETKWMTEQLLVTLAMLPSSFTSFRVIEDSCGRIARVNVACRVTIWPHLLFLGNGTSRADEPCKHSIIIVVRENTDLSSISRLVGSAPLVLRVALKIMTARASMLRLLPPLSPPSPLLVVLFHRTLPRFFFVTSLTDRPWWAEFPETKEERGDGRGRFFFSIVFTRRVFKRFAREEFFWRPKSRVQWALGTLQQWCTPIWRMEKEFVVESYCILLGEYFISYCTV